MHHVPVTQGNLCHVTLHLAGEESGLVGQNPAQILLKDSPGFMFVCGSYLQGTHFYRHHIDVVRLAHGPILLLV